MRNDFDFMQQIIKEFLAQKHILQRLAFIKKENVNDWEKWLQIELFHFMKYRDDIGYVRREVLYACDISKNHLQNNMYIDLVFRKKRASKDYLIQVELKCSKSATKLFNGIESDIEKVMSMRDSQDNGRSFWCVGFYTEVNEKGYQHAMSRMSGYYYQFHGVSKNKAVGYVIY